MAVLPEATFTRGLLLPTNTSLFHEKSVNNIQYKSIFITFITVIHSLCHSCCSDCFSRSGIHVTLSLNLFSHIISLIFFKLLQFCKSFQSLLFLSFFKTPLKVLKKATSVSPQFPLPCTIYNYWMRLSMISRVIQTELLLFAKAKLRRITTTRSE